MTTSNIEKCLSYTFETEKGKEFLRIATTIGLYEYQECLGDAVLQYLTTMFVDSLGAKTPGEMTTRRSLIACNDACSYYAKSVALKEALEQQNGCNLSDKVLADMFEAIVYAVHSDQDFEVQKTFSWFVSTFGDAIATRLESQTKKYKSLLQEICQKRTGSPPIYKYITTGPSHLAEFHAIVDVGFGATLFTGSGAKTKLLAAENAAKLAYEGILELDKCSV